jgi:hypothetical protein
VVGAEHVFLAGATGDSATHVNGLYEPTSEVSSGGVTVYRKVDRWLEYHAGAGQWQVKCTADKGNDNCYASCAVPAKCLPEQCAASEWLVTDSGAQESVTVCTVGPGVLGYFKAMM